MLPVPPSLMDIHDARRKMYRAQLDAQVAAAEYRDQVALIVAFWKRTEQCSVRRAAKRLGLAESSLRALLRSPGSSRRK